MLVYRRGLASSWEKAQRLILAGQVLVDGRLVDKVATLTDEDAEIDVRRGPPYVSRGGVKLAKALDTFSIVCEGAIAADVGASTGGFTDCLLQRGAARVYAIDVGYGQLDWKLRQDPRVIVMERTNARYLQSLPERIDLVTIDVVFISLRLILPMVRRWLSDTGQVIALIKPQFEAGRRQVAKGGVVRDEQVHRAVLSGVLGWAADRDWFLQGLTRSPIKGAKGNVEFLAWLSSSASGEVLIDLPGAIDEVMLQQD
jgi:23S rRNA (cytidine1920-2'-O)/16S rRNA (cytidine1409-2'-O)-methyltransferase